MASLVVSCVGEALGDGAPLHGEVAVVVERCHLIDTPTERAVVEDDVLVMAPPAGISSIVDIHGIAATHTDEAHDHVVGIHCNGVITEGDAIARSCLSGNGHIALRD